MSKSTKQRIDKYSELDSSLLACLHWKVHFQVGKNLNASPKIAKCPAFIAKPENLLMINTVKRALESAIC